MKTFKLLKTIGLIIAALFITNIGLDIHKELIIHGDNQWGFHEYTDLGLLTALIVYPVCKYWITEIKEFLNIND